ncbi:tetratricopeptide repeat protein [Rhodoferax sp.]|uniref:O-linked N-acetylglucosamine transferase, SPINDLY family protein n=1 Tax=Rhodoferax sp. TaxID=50421 RepID=UPI003784B7FF
MDTQAGKPAQFGHTITQAWQGSMDFAALLDQAAQLEAEGAGHLAAVLYQTWLSRNTSPYAHAAYFNYALVLSNAGDLSGAEGAYRKAIEIYPAFVQPRLNLGMLYERMGQIDSALDQWRWVAEHTDPAVADQSPLLVMALNHLGRVLETRKQLADASRYLARSLEINPHQSDALHHWVHLQQKQCIWPVYATLPGVSLQAMQQATSALAMLSISDDPQAQLDAARRFVEKKVQSAVPQLSAPRNYGHRRLRIGYVSSDFCLHPVSMLMAELFELHDRSRFEVYGYCWSPEDGSALRQRVIASMDHFRRIHDLGDYDAAQRIRADEIDVLVDLQGQTSGARANLLAYRPAPIQITYLGLPATTGLPSIDYVIADRFLIPESAARWYSEKPLYLPDIYQVSDRKRTVGARPSRFDCGLPEDAFVFCSLNNNFKYTPEVFAVWMNILKRTPNSVLWLLADNPWAQTNLCAAAQAHGVDAARLVFAGRVLPPDYLARYACADLFLDTFPFNAGTTANDALWMGLPLLTLCGRSFAARMAGALLTAADLPELICYDLKSYEEKAVALAQQPSECARLRAHLQTVRSTGRLFDTTAFARHLESALEGLVQAL